MSAFGHSVVLESHYRSWPSTPCAEPAFPGICVYLEKQKEPGLRNRELLENRLIRSSTLCLPPTLEPASCGHVRLL